MAVPFWVPPSHVKFYRVSAHNDLKETNIYRFPQGYFAKRRQYPQIKIDVRTDKPLTAIPRLT